MKCNNIELHVYGGQQSLNALLTVVKKLQMHFLRCNFLKCSKTAFPPPLGRQKKSILKTCQHSPLHFNKHLCALLIGIISGAVSQKKNGYEVVLSWIIELIWSIGAVKIYVFSIGLSRQIQWDWFFTIILLASLLKCVTASFSTWSPYRIFLWSFWNRFQNYLWLWYWKEWQNKSVVVALLRAWFSKEG